MMRLRLSSVIVFAALTAIGKKPMDATFSDDLARLELAAASADIDIMRRQSAAVLERWKLRDATGYEDMLFQVARLLTVKSFANREAQIALRDQYVLDALGKIREPNVGVSLPILYRLLQFLADPRGEDTSSEAWPRRRAERAKAWLETRRLVMLRTKPEAEDEEPVPLSVSPPTATGLRAGVAPEAIRDPALRKEYELAIEEHRRVLAARLLQHHLRLYGPSIVSDAERYVVATYLRAPHVPGELQRLLEESDVEPSTRDRILAAIPPQDR
jgi:hypothetical protein